jgi:Tfp pilus assembly protein FimT
VLTMLVVIGALSLPAFRAPFANQRLRKAGELIRVEWAKARNQAMKTGQIQVFRYAADGQAYWVEPYLTEQDALELDRDTARQLGLESSLGRVATPRLPAGQDGPISKQLPEGVVFAGGAVDSDSRLMLVQQEFAGPRAAGSRDTIPILFYPDGTSSDTRLILMNEQQFFVLIALRGLTGIARVSDLLSYDQISQLQ